MNAFMLSTSVCKSDAPKNTFSPLVPAARVYGTKLTATKNPPNLTVRGRVTAVPPQFTAYHKDIAAFDSCNGLTRAA